MARAFYWVCPPRFVLVVFCSGSLASGLGCSLVVGEKTEQIEETRVNPHGNTITTATGLQYLDLVVGTGSEAKPGSTVIVHYTGWLTDGQQFDSSLDHSAPFSFRIGEERVIKGWDEGVVGMKVGGKRKLTIPPQLGYGSRGGRFRGKIIPRNATLIFEIELLEVR